ncbi:hypothetical protein FA10DRAFT_229492 [Acaromyces ingoldii]|uniref:7alpha-cephem-methoxylase P8 chain related protein n=1 Tax=Acaromyces ingoldii TaxID=215250 RepID=A0A316YQV1_9BASI|nr:hypothetical protein FA10DRAFT_229492 [Acaromyces ingoldii]PWN91048.1 hypothetical protein FA10DRAFT_229492 [Acaromyces ingoldii]
MSTTTITTTATEPVLPQIQAEITYLDRAVTKPYQYLCPSPAGDRKDNFVRTPTPVRITDLSRTSAQQRSDLGISTRQAGFEIVPGFGREATASAWQAEKWNDDAWLRDVYYADTDALVKQHLLGRDARGRKVTNTFVFDHTVRKSQTAHLPDTPENRKPVSMAHCDQSRWSGENRIRRHLGDEVLARVKRGEVQCQLVNVWRPLRGPVEEHPLAMADSRSVTPSDWEPSELRYETWTGQTLLIHPPAEGEPQHKWYYYKGLDTNQAILLKCYDSETETRTPHTAFIDPTTARDAAPRWSIELRVLVLIE